MKKVKNVLHLISTIGCFGAEKMVIELAMGLSTLEYKPYIGIISNLRNLHLEFAKEVQKNNLEVKIFNCNYKFDFRTLLEIRSFLKRNKIYIIHSHGYKSNLYCILASFFVNTKKITTCHNWIGKNLKMKLYEQFDKILLNNFNRIVVVSHELEKKILKFHISPEKVTVINNGINLTRFQIAYNIADIKEILGIKISEKIIGTVGRLTQEKGHFFLLKAFAKIAAIIPNIKLLIVGDGPLRNNLEFEVRNLNLNSRIIFTGTRADIPEMLNIMDIFVLPSLTEGSPMALLEAMGCKKSVIATKVGAIPNIISDGYSGLLVEPKNILQLSDTMFDLVTNREKSEFLAQNAYETIRTSFCADKMVKEYVKVYKNLSKLEN